MSSKCS